MKIKYYILFANLLNSLFLHGNTWSNSSDNLKKEHWKKFIETKINLKENSNFLFMNHSLSILQKYEKRSPMANIEMVTELINNISNINARSEQFDAGKLEADIFVMLLSEVIEQANYLRAEKLLNSTQKISKSFERFITKSTIPENYVIKTENLSVLSLRLNKSEKTVNGFVKKVNSSEINSVDSLIDSDQVEASAALHINLTNLTYSNESFRISYAVYKYSVLFDLKSSVIQINDNCSTINTSQIISNVVSISSNEIIAGSGYEPFVFAKFRTLKSAETCVNNLSEKIKFKCVFWDYKKSEWSTKGCIYFLSKENLHACQCNHLTNFAILMSLDTETISCKLCNTILKYLTYVGNCMSMLGLLCTIAVYLSDKIKFKRRLKHQRFNSNENRFKLMFDYYIEILICLSTSLFLLNLFYVIFSFLKWDESSNSCIAIGVLLHYFLLGSFSWMLSLSILQYFTFNRIFVTIQNYFIKALIFSLGAPVVPIGIILSINWELYKHPNLTCWLSGKTAILGVIAPLATIVVINLIIFGLITKNHCKLKKISESKMESKKKTVIVSTCFLNMGLTWTLGFIMLIEMGEYARLAFALLFCLLNAFQGFFIFLVYIILSKSRRQMLLKKFGNLKLCKIVLELEEFDKNSKKNEVTRQTTVEQISI